VGITELLLVGLVGVVAAVGLVAVLVARDRRRRNQVVPGTDTGAPSSWAGSHTPEARLHRRLRDAVLATRAVDDPDGSLLAARVEVEHAALATDRHLVALAAMPEREAASRMPAARAAVKAVESAASSIADIGGAGRSVIATAGPGELPAVVAAAERVELLREAIEEVDEVDLTVARPEPPRPPNTVVIDSGVTAAGPEGAGRSTPASEDDEGRRRRRTTG
jgi:hypothetical protein